MALQLPTFVLPLIHRSSFMRRTLKLQSRVGNRTVIMSAQCTNSNAGMRGRIDNIRTSKSGHFVRQESAFRNQISTEADADFKAEDNRYHLYVSLACPWACRVLAVRALKGLEHVFPVTVVHHYLGDKGWRFISEGEKDAPAECEVEPLFGCKTISEMYLKANPQYSGRNTVPMLWDTKLNAIVNNESAELIIMLNNSFNDYAANAELDLYPEPLRPQIDSIYKSVYESVNNGVYRCGFAQSQLAYDEAVENLFVKLDELEEHLSKSRYLVGTQMTLADICLFMTLIRFDIVYVCHFKTNKKRIFDYPNLRGFTSELYQIPKIRSVVNFEHIKRHYFESHVKLNPFGIVPAGPELSYLDQPHGRDSL